MQATLHTHQFLPLPFQHAAHRNTRPRGHHTRDILFGHLFTEQTIAVLFVNRRLGRGQFLFQFWNTPVLDLRGRGQIARALSGLLIAPRLLDLAVDDARRINRRLLVLPLTLELRRAFLEVRQLFLQLLQPLARGRILFLFERCLLNLQLQDLTLQLINLHRH